MDFITIKETAMKIAELTKKSEEKAQKFKDLAVQAKNIEKNSCEYKKIKYQMDLLSMTVINFEDPIMRMTRAVNSKKRQKIVCLCGSTKFKKEFEEANRKETLKGNIVLSIEQFSHANSLNITEKEKKTFDRVHKDKILLADEILVLNVDGYIGNSTKNEIEFALVNNKKVRYLEKK